MPFVGDACQIVMFEALRSWVLAASPNAAILDDVGNTVKTFTLTTDDVLYYQIGATAIFKIHIRDESNESYNIKRVQVFGQNPEGGSPITVIDHTLEQTYSKTPDKILEIYIYTGIQNVV